MMARTALSVQEIVRTGLDPSYEAANTDGESVANDGRTFVHVDNASGGSINVTVVHPGTVDGLAVADLVVAVPAGEDRMIAFSGAVQPDGERRGEVVCGFQRGGVGDGGGAEGVAAPSPALPRVLRQAQDAREGGRALDCDPARAKGSASKGKS
jgi:hypothetical protein